MPFRGMPNRGFMRGGPMGNPIRGGGFGRGGPFGGGQRGQVKCCLDDVSHFLFSIFFVISYYRIEEDPLVTFTGDLAATTNVSREAISSKAETTEEWVTTTTTIITNSNNKVATSGTRPLGNKIICRGSHSNKEETHWEGPGTRTMHPQVACGTMGRHESLLIH